MGSDPIDKYLIRLEYIRFWRWSQVIQVKIVLPMEQQARLEVPGHNAIVTKAIVPALKIRPAITGNTGHARSLRTVMSDAMPQPAPRIEILSGR